jgi:hypothetical protein
MTPEQNRLALGPVKVLASGLPGTSWMEGPEAAIPEVGNAFFYLVQYHDAKGASGYGTASAPLPREPASCNGGCP